MFFLRNLVITRFQKAGQCKEIPTGEIQQRNALWSEFDNAVQTCYSTAVQCGNCTTATVHCSNCATVQCGNVIGSASSFFFRSRKSRAMPPTNFFLPPGWCHQPTPPHSSAGQSLLFPIHEQSLTADGQWAKFASSLLRRLVVDWTTDILPFVSPDSQLSLLTT